MLSQALQKHGIGEKEMAHLANFGAFPLNTRKRRWVRAAEVSSGEFSRERVFLFRVEVRQGGVGRMSGDAYRDDLSLY